MLKLELDPFDQGDTISIAIDSHLVETVVNADKQVYFSLTSDWKIAGDLNPKHKNPLRSGPFKEAFNHRMVFVYGTSGTAKENQWAYNKARHDAEVWYYRGNGSVDIIPDREFEAARYPDRGVILFGNATTNTAWNKLLKDCPIQVTRERITLGADTFSGSDLAAYFLWPRADSNIASVAVITGTGLAGLQATDANQYFAAGSGFPDYMIFTAEMLKSGARGLKAAGFYDNEWRLPGN
jgi:hypothetical protein